MKKTTLVLSALTLALGASLSWSADQPDATQPATPSAVTNPRNSGMNSNAPANNTNPASPTGGSQAALTPPADWTNLKGTVQAVDPTAKTVQIQDDSGKLLQVPINRQVKIEKDGKKVNLSQVQTGDVIILAKRNVSPQPGSTMGN